MFKHVPPLAPDSRSSWMCVYSTCYAMLTFRPFVSSTVLPVLRKLELSVGSTHTHTLVYCCRHNRYSDVTRSWSSDTSDMNFSYFFADSVPREWDEHVSLEHVLPLLTERDIFLYTFITLYPLGWFCCIFRHFCRCPTPTASRRIKSNKFISLEFIWHVRSFYWFWYTLNQSS